MREKRRKKERVVLTGGVGTWIRVLVTPAFSEKSRSRGSATNCRTESQLDALTMSMRVEEKDVGSG